MFRSSLGEQGKAAREVHMEENKKRSKMPLMGFHQTRKRHLIPGNDV